MVRWPAAEDAGLKVFIVLDCSLSRGLDVNEGLSVVLYIVKACFGGDSEKKVLTWHVRMSLIDMWLC